MSKEQGSQLQAGDATGRDCRRTPTVLMVDPTQWIGGGAA